MLACAARLDGCIGALCVAGVAPFDAKDLDYFAGRGQNSESAFCYVDSSFTILTKGDLVEDVDGTNAALQGEVELRKLVEPQRLSLLNADAAGITKELSSILPEVDRKVLLENEDMGNHLIETLKEGLKNSSDGWVDDDLAFVKPWGFSFDEIKTKVLLYQGSEDLMVPYAHGQWLAESIPRKYIVPHLIQGEGHYSIWTNQMDNMLKELLSLRYRGEDL